MEEGDRSWLIRKPQLEDVPELIHLIQSYLVPKEAARTCILSKSWLHAWSTIPTLRFSKQVISVSPTQRANQLMMVDRTLQRYLQDNIPFETIDLVIHIKNQVSDSLAEKWIRSVATRTCVKELSLRVDVYVKAPYTLPGEIFSSKNIRKISIRTLSNYLFIGSNSMINCVSLRVLDLGDVNISEEVLENLLSTCSLLEEVKLSGCKGLKTIKVKNLQYLCKLMINAGKSEDNLEIYDVPNLSCFKYYSLSQKDFHSFTRDSLGSVTELLLQGVIIDKAFLDMIKLKFRLLQNLTLKIKYWSSQSFDITCLSMKRLSVWFNLSPIHIKVQVFAPKLRLFNYDGKTMPSLIFPAITPEQIEVGLDMNHPIDGSFFVKMREALMLSSNFDINIRAKFDVAVPLNIDFDDLRRRVPFPATNLQHLSVQTTSKKSLPEYSPFFDAFFSICHPKYVIARMYFKENNYLCKLMIKEVMENNSRKGSWPHYLQDVEVKNPHNGNWETLTDSWKSLIIKLAPYEVEFKLNWCSL